MTQNWSSNMTLMEEKQTILVAEKQQSFINGFINRTQENQTKPMEKQLSFQTHQPRKARAFEKQVSFQGVLNVENHHPSRLGRSMAKQLSFRGVNTTENHKRVVMEKLPSFGRATMERQKSFRVVMERQLSFISERRKKTESPGKRGDSPLHIAARTGNLGKVKELIQGSCDGDGEELKELLSKQNLEGETPLYTAAENGHSVVVEEMVKHMNLETASMAARNGFDPFHVAAKQGHLEVLKKLLGTFPNLAMTTDSSCTTALHTAATQGHIDVVNLLLETDSNLAKIAKNNGKTALHSAARMGHVEVVKSLIDNDPSIGFRTDKKGQTALHMAVKAQNDGIVVELVKPDVAVLSVEDNKGNTPLHIATNKGRVKIMRCLVSFEGINLNPMNKAGDTPLDTAEKIGNAELVLVLKEAGAATAKDLGKPQNPAKQLKQTVSDIKHEVQSQLQQSRQTGVRVQKIAKRLKKLHISGLNNAINSATVVAVLIATVAFAAIFTVPGQYEEDRSKGVLLGQAHIANKAPFLVFFVFDSLALYILSCCCGPDFSCCD